MAADPLSANSSRPAAQPRLAQLDDQPGCVFEWEENCLLYSVRLVPLEDFSVPVERRVRSAHFETDRTFHVHGDLGEDLRPPVTALEQRAVNYVERVLSQPPSPVAGLLRLAGFTLQNATLRKRPRGPNPPTPKVVLAAAVVLFSEGHSRRQIAELAGFAEGNVKRWLNRARITGIGSEDRSDAARAREILAREDLSARAVLAAWGNRTL